MLVVGREPALARSLKRGLQRHGVRVGAVCGADGALAALQEARPDAVIVDLAAVGPGCATLLRRMRGLDPAIPVIAVAAAGRSAGVAEAIAEGALVLSWPVAGEAVHALLARAYNEQRRAAALDFYREREAQRAGLDRLLGESTPMLRLKVQLRLLLDAEARRRDAPADAVLLHGDTGTGKGEVARALHFDGARRARPFVRVDIDDLASPLAEARIFGSERGAFPGARERRLGLVDVADGGTLFISEVGALAPSLQLRLVELLDHAVVRRMGSTREVPVNVRVVAATRCPPETLVRAGRLRPELYGRLADAPLELVPLRERGDDLWLLARRFVQWQAERQGFAPPDLNGEARSLLARHLWPGNVRELRHALERAVLVQSGGVIDGCHIALAPSVPALNAPPPVPERSLPELERDALTRALDRAYGNVSQAARMLGISRDTMRYRIAKHELERTQPDRARA